MIKNNIELSDDFEKCEALYEKLSRVMELKRSYDLLKADFRGQENRLITSNNLLNVSNLNNSDTYLADAFNNCIIKYVMEKYEKIEEDDKNIW